MPTHWISLVFSFQVLFDPIAAEAKSICADESDDEYMKKICIKISKPYSYRYSESQVKQHSKCKNYVRVEKGIGEETKMVGLCHVAEGVIKCLIKGPGEFDLTVYQFLNDKCSSGEIKNNYLKETSSGGGGGILQMFLNLFRFRCFGS